MLKDIKKKKLNTVTLNSGKQLSPAEVEAKQKAVRKLQVHNDDNNNNEYDKSQILCTATTTMILATT